jgi:AmmeMemoRadiSam system protein A
VVDVAENAFAAAFLDPRFPPLASQELVRLHLHISRLSPLEPLEVGSEEDLLGRLEPGVHGVVLAQGERRATFLPQVWETLPDPREFLRHLRIKAGLDAAAWASGLRVHRYTVETVE